MEKLFENFSEYLENINEKYTDDAKSSNDPELDYTQELIRNFKETNNQDYQNFRKVKSFGLILNVLGNFRKTDIKSSEIVILVSDENKNEIIDFLVKNNLKISIPPSKLADTKLKITNFINKSLAN